MIDYPKLTDLPNPEDLEHEVVLSTSIDFLTYPVHGYRIVEPSIGGLAYNGQLLPIRTIITRK